MAYFFLYLRLVSVSINARAISLTLSYFTSSKSFFQRHADVISNKCAILVGAVFVKAQCITAQHKLKLLLPTRPIFQSACNERGAVTNFPSLVTANSSSKSLSILFFGSLCAASHNNYTVIVRIWLSPLRVIPFRPSHTSSAQSTGFLATASNSRNAV